MRFFARSLVPFAVASGFALVSSLAAAQTSTAPAPAPPPPGGGATAAPPSTPPPADAKPAPDEKKGDIGGFTFHDQPAQHAAAPQRVFRRAGGPLATFPGFEQLTDGGSRLFVQLSQTVPVEERRASGSVTYVLKGAHLRVHNDSNALVTVHFNTPVYRARLTPSGNDLLFILELRSAATPTFKVTDNTDKTSTLTIDFAKGDFLTADTDAPLPAETRPATATKSGTTRRGRGSTTPPVTPGPTP